MGEDYHTVAAKPMALPQWPHSPVEVFLSLCGIVLPLLLWTDSFLSYVVLLTPLFMLFTSKWLGVVLVVGAASWPDKWNERTVAMRLLLGVVGFTLLWKAASQGEGRVKYRMTPTKVPNSGIPLLI